MHLQQIPIQPETTRNFSYVLTCPDTAAGALVDPAFGLQKIADRIEETETRVEYILNTHGHHDHVHGNEYFKERTGARIANHPADGTKRDVDLQDGARLQVGNLRIEVLHTPGHSPGSCCLHVNNEVLLTGDTLFVGKVGGTSDRGEDARNQYESLHNRIMKLNPDTKVYPGHDYGPKPHSTLSWESRHNPFLLQDTFDDFCELKENWEQEKPKWEAKWEEVLSTS